MGGVGRLSIIVQIANYNEQQKKMHKMRELCSFFSFSYFFSKLLLFFQGVAWKMIYSLLNSGHFEPLLANITFPKTWKSYGCFFSSSHFEHSLSNFYDKFNSLTVPSRKFCAFLLQGKLYEKWASNGPFQFYSFSALSAVFSRFYP